MTKGPFVSFVLFVSLVAGAVEGQQPTAPATQAQQKPVFRGGTHFVRVDAYPTSKDGRIVEGLRPEDFAITEDGKPQTIESFDYISFPTFTPDAERHDPDSQRDGFALAADPRYRVFVIVVDVHFSPTPTARKDDLRLWNMQQPLTHFLDRVVGPNDLFGFLTTRNSGKDLVLGQKTTSVEAQLSKLWQSSMMEYDSDVYQLQQKCGSAGVQLAGRLRADRTYTSLESLVTELGSLRDERKSVIFVADNLTRDRPSQALAQLNGKDFPHAGIVNGHVGIGDDAVTGGNDQYCIGEMKRLGSMDFEDRYQDLLRSARSANVAFYPIAPSGVPIPTPYVSGVDAAHRAEDSLVTLANQTDGVPFVANDLARTVDRLVDDLAAYYLLGYYTTNTKWDGGLRTIKVKLQSSGESVRARRQYRAPTKAEIAALANGPAARASVPSGPAQLVGEGTAFRVAFHQPPERVSKNEFTRTDRLRVEWPVLGALDRREARLLDSSGKPLPIDVPLSETEGGKSLVAELPLAPFAKGVYSIELTAGAGGKIEQRRLTFTMR